VKPVEKKAHEGKRQSAMAFCVHTEGRSGERGREDGTERWFEIRRPGNGKKRNLPGIR